MRKKRSTTLAGRQKNHASTKRIFTLRRGQKKDAHFLQEKVDQVRTPLLETQGI